MVIQNNTEDAIPYGLLVSGKKPIPEKQLEKQSGRLHLSGKEKCIEHHS